MTALEKKYTKENREKIIAMLRVKNAVLNEAKLDEYYAQILMSALKSKFDECLIAVKNLQ